MKKMFTMCFQRIFLFLSRDLESLCYGETSVQTHFKCLKLSVTLYQFIMESLIYNCTFSTVVNTVYQKTHHSKFILESITDGLRTHSRCIEDF